MHVISRLSLLAQIFTIDYEIQIIISLNITYKGLFINARAYNEK